MALPKGFNRKTEDTADGAERETPDWLYNLLDNEFGFDLDAAASDVNHKCPNYFTQEDDALTQSWGYCDKGGGVHPRAVWLNPPYGRKIGRWLKKARQEAALHNLTVVCLVPARTDNAWWWGECLQADEIRFLPKRVRFLNPRKEVLDRPTFGSAIVIFKGRRLLARFPKTVWWEEAVPPKAARPAGQRPRKPGKRTPVQEEAAA